MLTEVVRYEITVDAFADEERLRRTKFNGGNTDIRLNASSVLDGAPVFRAERQTLAFSDLNIDIEGKEGRSEGLCVCVCVWAGVKYYLQ